MGVLDALIRTVAPRRALARAEAGLRLAQIDRVRQVYDGAQLGRRAEAWRVVSTDANAEGARSRKTLREVSRDLCRNNAYAARAKRVISHNVVGTGIIPSIQIENPRQKKQVDDLFKAHFDTTAIDALGRHDLYGLESLVTSTTMESGECLVRRRPRRRADGFPLPFQLQVMEPDYLDTLRTGTLSNGNTAIQGIEYDLIGRIVAYWLYDRHPGSSGPWGSTANLESKRVPAEFIAHVYWTDRAEEGRGIPWVAPVIQRMRDLGDYADAQLLKQKAAACFVAFITDNGEFSDGLSAAQSGSPYRQEKLEPGMISHLKMGEGVEFGSPPQVSDYDGYTKAVLHEIAAGLGISYEALTGDLSGVNFSSGRMGWLEFQRSIDAWRNHMLIPQFCARVAQWGLDAAAVEIGRPVQAKIGWTAPRREMVSPAQEVPAIISALRAGITSLPEEQRKLGFDSEDLLREIAESNKLLDDLGITLDSDPRKTTQNGGVVAPPVDPNATKPDPNAAAQAAADQTIRVVAEMNKSVTATMGETLKAIAVSARPAPQAPMSIVLDEKHITVDATRPETTEPETFDEAGRITSMIVRPVNGMGAVKRRKISHDANGRVNGTREEIISGGEANG